MKNHIRYWLAFYCLWLFGNTSSSQAQGHFDCMSNTGDSYSIVIEIATIDGQPFEIGDEIAVFTPDSICAGSIAPDSATNIALAAWKDDPQTPDVKDGFASGEVMSFKIWDASEDLEMIAIATYTTGDATFESGPFAIISILEGISNPAPVVTLPEDLIFPEDTQASFGLDSLVSDLNHPDRMLVWSVSGHQNVQVSIDTSTRVATFSPLPNWFGQEQITFTAVDPEGLSGSDTISILITPVNDVPEKFSLLEPPNGAQKDTLNFPLAWRQAVNVDPGDTVRYEVIISTQADLSDTLLFAAQLADTTYTIMDGLEPSRQYYWKVIAVDLAGAMKESDSVFSFRTSDTATDVDERKYDLIPTQFGLAQNYPNPFNPETTIQYKLPKTSQVKLVIYNLTGQRVATLVDEQQPTGFYSVQWNGKDDAGSNVASGVYLYRLETKEFVQVKKLALVR